MRQQANKITALILKAVALAMSVAVVVMNVLGATTVETSISLLSIGLLAIALSSFTGVKEPD
jgi:hypothetical protein